MPSLVIEDSLEVHLGAWWDWERYFGSLFAGVVCVLLSGVFPELTAVSH